MFSPDVNFECACDDADGVVLFGVDEVQLFENFQTFHKIRIIFLESVIFGADHDQNDVGKVFLQNLFSVSLQDVIVGKPLSTPVTVEESRSVDNLEPEVGHLKSHVLHSYRDFIDRSVKIFIGFKDNFEQYLIYGSRSTSFTLASLLGDFSF